MPEYSFQYKAKIKGIMIIMRSRDFANSRQVVRFSILSIGFPEKMFNMQNAQLLISRWGKGGGGLSE